ncbi:MAG TPA: DUF3987 domain-containing protein [Nitrososphaerales archaeon]|nr:DUF3987 domain-containing protein [Nitrososphaerales archaeon]
MPSGGFLRRYVEWSGAWLGSNVAYHMVSGLVLLSQSVPTDLAFPGVVPLRANLYGLLVGPSSVSQKTRAINAAQSVQELAIPGCPMATPGSPEACVDQLTGRPQVLFFDEFGSFLQASEKSQLSPLRMVLTKIYDCGRAERALVERQGRKRRKVEPNPRLSILAGITPGLLEAYTTQVDWLEGFLARFFTVHATSERRVRYSSFEERGGPEVRDGLVSLLKSYMAWGDLFSGSDPGPCQGLDEQAMRLWESWVDQILDRARNARSSVQAAIHRAQGHALKVALLLAWDTGKARHGGPWWIRLDDIAPAIDLTELHVQSVQEIAEGIATDKAERDERRLYVAFDRKPMSYSDALRRSGLTKKVADDALESLLEKRFLVKTLTEEGAFYARSTH